LRESQILDGSIQPNGPESRRGEESAKAAVGAKSELDGQQREFGETIRSSADALLTIINDILDFKIEAGKPLQRLRLERGCCSARNHT
jgi:signal transduction histidine kinase